MMCSALLFLVLSSTWCFSLNEICSESDVFLRLNEEIFPNNSYIPYNRIGTREWERLYCHSCNRNCCSVHNSDWYLPNGERVLGGYEYDELDVGVFARSRGYRSLGLYRHSHPQQRGRFRCVLPDAVGNNCTLFANIVNESPIIASQPLSKTITAGQNATFSTELSNGNVATYRWQKNNVDIEDSPGKYRGTNSAVFNIFYAQEQDEGDYHCIIDNILVSDAAELSVVSHPIMIPHNLMELNVTSGRDLEFSLYTDHFTESNATIAFYWKKDGYNISERHKYKGTTTQILTILDIQSRDEGFYSLNVVVANQNIRTINVSISVVTLSTEISPSATPEIGLQCNLTCTVTGVENLDPTIAYQWLKGGEIISSANDSVLTIQSLRHTDAGEYMCVANLSSEKLIPTFSSNINKTYLLCLTPDIGVTYAGRIINNESLIYFHEISKQDSTSGLVCRINNFNVSCDHETNNSQMHSQIFVSGDWYFPNGDLVPVHTATQATSTVFTQKRPGEIELYRFGHPSQTGRYFCTAPNTDKFYVYLRSHLSLSLRGVTLYNNSYINIGDIGSTADDEALQCHTDNINCCSSEHTENGSVLGEWYYPNGSRVLSLREISDTDDNSYVISDGFVVSRSQSVVRLFAGRGLTQSGHYCCEVPDEYGLNQTLCINLVVDDIDDVSHMVINRTEPDVVCLPSINNSNNSDLLNCEQLCISPMEVDNVSVLITVTSTADIGHSFTLNCAVVGINQSDNLLISYQWYKDEYLLQGARAPVLSFSSLSLSDIGSYVCEASIRSSSQGHGIIRSSFPYRINISSTLFQLRLYSVQNCIQWTSSDVISSRAVDVENIVTSSLRKHCQCNFTRSHITGGGFQCFAGSENHVTFRAQLREMNQRNSLELMTYLEDIVLSARSWLIHGQYLKLNLSCSLIITDIHSLECPQFGAASATSPPFSYNDESHIIVTHPTTADGVISCNVGYLIWALSSTFLLLLLMAIFGIMLSAKTLKRKHASNNTVYDGHHGSHMRARCNTRDINTDANYAYDKEIYQEIKPCSVVDQREEYDYEEAHSIGKKVKDFVND